MPELAHDRASDRRPGSIPAAAQGLAGLAQDPAVQAGLAFFNLEKRWINEQHLEVCRVPAPTFREQQRADYLVTAFREIGRLARIDEAGNVVVPITLAGDAPFIAVTAHMDTVLAPRERGDIQLRSDGTLQGPGVTDNGSGLAALLALARALDPGRLPPDARRNVLLVANVAEEGEGNLHGMNYLCRHSPFRSRIEGYLVLDGASTGHITAEALGSRRFKIVIEGPGGHSWNDFGRANPVHALGRAVAALADARLPPSPRTTLSVGVIEGGWGVNSIAPVARAKVDIRSRSNAAIHTAVETMQALVTRALDAENRGATDRLSGFKIREIGCRPAAPAIEPNPVVECLQSIDAYLGIHSRLDCASTDANVPLSLGCPAAAIGAGGRGGGAHSPAEWYSPQGRELGLQRIFLALASFLTRP